MDAAMTAKNTGFETIIVEKRGAVTLITLNRPQALNALSSTVQKELVSAFAAYEADDSQGCAVVTGTGEKAFAAGADIAEMAEKDATDFYLGAFFDGWQRDISARVRKPWIAAVNGFALGGGCELAMMADMIIASDKARFGQPEIKLGVAPGMGGTQRLTRAVGKAKAMDLCLTGRMMGAEEAEKSGLVARIFPHDEMLDKTLEIAAEIAAMPRVAALVNKEMVNAAFETVLEQGLLFERRMWQVLAASEDKTEGMLAFIEKREAVWKGR
jgi:enoyl-CoA hydratase